MFKIDRENQTVINVLNKRQSKTNILNMSSVNLMRRAASQNKNAFMKSFCNQII